MGLTASKRHPRLGQQPQQPCQPAGFSVNWIQHVGKRDNQEDAYAQSDLSNHMLFQENGALFVLADGMGGMESGELASSSAVQSARREFGALPPSWSEGQKLLFLVMQANQAVLSAVEKGSLGRSGCTLILVLIQNGQLWFASVGDSRVCLMRNGGLIQLNREHTFATDLDRAAARGEMLFDEAVVDPQRRALTSYLGLQELHLIDSNHYPIDLLCGDWVILMSDGVFNALSNDEISILLNDNPQTAGEHLIEAVLSKNDPHQDNFTAGIIQLH